MKRIAVLLIVCFVCCFFVGCNESKDNHSGTNIETSSCANGEHRLVYSDYYYDSGFCYKYTKCSVCGKYIKKLLSTQESQEHRIQETATQLKNKGYIVASSGYTFDKCVEAAQTYMKTKYNASFYKSSAVVAYKDLTYYYLTGYTYTEGLFTICISHIDGVWGIVTAKYA